MPISSQAKLGIAWKVQRLGRETRTVNNVRRSKWIEAPCPVFFTGDDIVRYSKEIWRNVSTIKTVYNSSNIYKGLV